jgi:DNA-binding XRE family transcriptional regulator
MSPIAEVAAGRGFTDKQLGEMFGVTEQTINNWKHEFPEFFEALQAGKAVCDDAVERSLFQRAMGYSHPDTHVTGNGKIIPIVKHYPPDPTSMIFWLKNRRKERWRDKQEVEHKGFEGLFGFLRSTSAAGNLTDGG